VTLLEYSDKICAAFVSVTQITASPDGARNTEAATVNK
jgi:hypothetical protein